MQSNPGHLSDAIRDAFSRKKKGKYLDAASQAAELRIGNYLKDNEVGSKDYFKCGVGDIRLIAESGDHEYSFVPLTAAWLISADFVPLYGKGMSGCDVFQRGRYRVLFHRDRKEYSMCVEGISPPTYIINDAEIKFVHQLQNLFFALTGIELYD